MAGKYFFLLTCQLLPGNTNIKAIKQSRETDNLMSKRRDKVKRYPTVSIIKNEKLARNVNFLCQEC